MPHDHDYAEEHDHEEGHDHGHAHALPDSSRAFAIGVLLNTGFVVAEVIFGLAANSLALLSDAGHNLSDVFGLLMAWGALRLAKSLPSKRRTYGWRRASILAALGNALLLLLVTGGIVWEAVGRFAHPETVAGGTVMWVAGLGVVINTATALLFMAGREKDLNVKGAFMHMAADAVLALGVVVVGVVILLTGWHWLDPAMSLLISVVIVYGTWGLLRESVDLAMDAVPAKIDPQAVEAFLAQRPGVTAVHDLHIWAMSTTEVALTAHLVMPKGCPSDEFLHETGHELEEQFGIGHTTLQMELGDTGEECHQAPAAAL